MEKILPIVMPPVETYQSTSFVMAMICASDNMKDAFYNYYNNIFCTDTSYMKTIGLGFTDSSWNVPADDGLAEMDLFHLSNIAKDKFIAFLKERIDQDNYLLLYNIDEYYLSYSKRYQVKHYIHDTYIYGYEEDKFCVMAQKKGKLQMSKVDSQEIVDGMYGQIEENPSVHFCSFRFRNVKATINKEKIKQDLKDYLLGIKKTDDDKVYGTAVYQIIRKCSLARAEGRKEEGDLFDLRIFRMLWEHKKVMLLHLEKMNELYHDQLSDCLLKMGEIEHLANKIFLLAMKFTVTKRNDLLCKISDNLQVLEMKEIECYKELVEKL
jgi:hypothetical protein